jgi:hypothetical protein
MVRGHCSLRVGRGRVINISGPTAWVHLPLLFALAQESANDPRHRRLTSINRLSECAVAGQRW